MTQAEPRRAESLIELQNSTQGGRLLTLKGKRSAEEADELIAFVRQVAAGEEPAVPFERRDEQPDIGIGLADSLGVPCRFQ